jgi:hypothetical protein
MGRWPLALFLMSCTSQQPEPAKGGHLWLWGETATQDAVRAADTEFTLRARYGAANVTRERINLGEGETAPGVVLFARDSTRRLQVQFVDTNALREPIRATVTGRRSNWILYPGASIGTTLAELEQLNGREFRLLGLGWDYSGTVVSWNGGTLGKVWTDEGSAERRVIVRLAQMDNADQTLVARVLGDHEYSSAAMRTLNPRVYEIVVRPR